MKRFSAKGEAVYAWGIVLLLGVLAFVIRALPWRNFLDRDGAYLFYGPDSYDHLRRITLGLTTFPSVPSFDSYYGYPVGTGQIWSPFFDYLLTVLALLCGAKPDSDAVVQTIGFWLSPFLAFATIILLYLVATRLIDRCAALFSIIVLAVLPGHILYSFVSELDHHVAEPPVCLGLLHALLGGNERLRRGASGGIVALPAAIWFLISILIWRGSIIFWGITLLALLLQCGAALTFARPLRLYASYARNVALFSAAALTPICLLNGWGSAGGMKFGIVSWFHVGLLLVVALCFGMFVYDSGVRSRILKASIMVCGSAALFLLLPTGRRFLAELLAGLAVIGGSDPWLDSISELRPMLFPAGSLTFAHATETLSLLYWLFPALIIWVARRWLAGRGEDFRLALFVSWGAVFWILPLFRERYVHLTAVALAVGAGMAYQLLTERFGTLSIKGIKATVAIGLFLCLLPIAPFLGRLPAVALVDAERYDLPETLSWLRSHTPETSYFTRPSQVPEYGVLAEWGIGAYIDYVARRPTVATNFGWETHGLYESATFLSTADPAVARQLLDINRVRYLLLSNISGQLPRLWAIAEQGRDKRLVPSVGPFRPLASMYYRLYMQDGAAFAVQGTELPALGCYRLVYESSGKAPEVLLGAVSHYKVFEYISGALLSGMVSPGSEVTVELLLQAGSGRQFQYRDRTVSDGTGKFALWLPYATTDAVGDITPLGAYQVQSGFRSGKVTVRPGDVVDGVRLVFQPQIK